MKLFSHSQLTFLVHVVLVISVTFIHSACQRSGVIIQADFPGGNIIKDSMVNHTIYVRPDQKGTDTTKGNWFYWYFEISGAQGSEKEFVFNQQHSLTRKGPAFSKDNGQSWQFLFPDTLASLDDFTFTFGKEDRRVQFCLTIPYVEEDFRVFEASMQKRFEPFMQQHDLTATNQGRNVPYYTLKGNSGQEIQKTLFFTSRHHACESTANFVLEGMMEYFAERLLEKDTQVDLMRLVAVPFVDLDGVQLGEQGKDRYPHDHNRDYIQFIYPETKAITEVFKELSEETAVIAIDMHCPWIKYNQNERLFFIGQEKREFNDELKALSHTIARKHQGELPFDSDISIFPFGKDWNSRTIEESRQTRLMSFAQWCSMQPNVVMATTLEVPYASVMGATITRDNLREFGRSVMKSIIFNSHNMQNALN